MTKQELLSKLSIAGGYNRFGNADRSVVYEGDTQLAIEEDEGVMLFSFDNEYIIKKLGEEAVKDIQKHAWAVIKWIQIQGFKVVMDV